MQEIEGRIVNFEVLKRAKKKDGQEYVFYKYIIKDKQNNTINMTGFSNPQKYLHKWARFIYEEKPNKNPKFEPIKSLKSAIEIDEPEDSADNLDIEDELRHNSPFFGMIYNNTCNYIKDNKNGMTFDKDFDKVFDNLWKLAVKKKKEIIKCQ